jgi:hypothetical protein
MLYLVAIHVVSYQVKLLMFYNVQTTALTFVGNTRYIIRLHIFN